jgi:transglycosylase-like protein
MRMRRTLAAVGLVFAGGAALAAWWSARTVEARVAEVLRRQGTPAGLTIGAVGFSWAGPVRLSTVVLAPASGERLTIQEVRVGWGLAGGRDERAHVRRLSLHGVRLERGALVVEWPAADLDVLSWKGGGGEEHVRVRQRPAGGELDAQVRKTDAARDVALVLSSFDLSAARLTWQSEALLAPGVWTGRLKMAQVGDHATTEGELAGQGVRFALPRGLGLGSGEYGAATAVALGWNGVRDGESVDVRRLTARVGGLEIDGHGRLAGAGEARTIELQAAAHSDLGSALQTTAMRLPASLTLGPADRLGTASFDVAVDGLLARPADLRIVPHLRYESTPQVTQKLEFLRRPFRFAPAEGNGVTVDIREGAPDFMSLAQVPPLLLRALLISEDAGFYGHPGIDVAEIPLAWAANVERGTSARGASTITQQLVKNLFLAKDKSYARKLEEAALALLVDAAVPKTRILEIYVNVIEWGPNLFGLVPAARHYFGKVPAELTPKEIAFLVCLIPSPVRYHQAHATGRLGPGMEQLTANLLAKLRSVDAITEDEYEDALAEQPQFRPEGEDLEPRGAGTD